MELSLRGHEGRIKVGYQVAAVLSSFVLTPAGPNTWEVSATVKTADTFWLSQSPQVLELTVGKQRWRWAASGLKVDGGAVSGTVTGRPERR